MQNKNEGITLVALIITIVVMLILVAVSVNVIIKSNLIGTAEKTVNKYKTASEEESNSGVIEIDGKKYNSIDDYLAEKAMLTYDGTPKENGVLTAKAKYESDGKTAIIPKGFKIIEDTEGKKSIDAGLVIQDSAGNEFVWVPVTVEGTTDAEKDICLTN